MFSYKDANHQVVGPLSTDAIRQLITAGAIGRHTLLRAEGTDFWEPAARCQIFQELFDQIKAPGNEPVASGDASTVNPPSEPVIDVTAEATPEPPLQSATAKPSSGPDAADSSSEAKPALFFMIGGDGREYGPVTAEQLREWITQRRANAQTRIRRQDGKDFAPLGAWPEFADALGGSAKTETPPPKPPPLDASQADQMAEEIIGRRLDVRVGSCFSRAWKLYTSNFGILTGTTALALVLDNILHSVVGVGNVVAVALSGVFAAGLGVVFLKAIRNERPDVNDMFAGFNKAFVQLMLASVLVSIFVSIGLFVCVLPGIYLIVAYLFTYQLALDRSLEFWPAMELSRRVVHERWWELFALFLGAVLLVMVGLVLGGIGVFFTAPIAFAAIMYAYDDIFGRQPNPSAEAGT